MKGFQVDHIQREREKYCALGHVYGAQKDGTDDPACRAAKEIQT